MQSIGNKESIKVTTKMAFALLGFVKKTNIKEHFIKVAKEQTKLTTKKNNLYLELYSRCESKQDDMTQELTVSLLNEHTDMASQISAIDDDLNNVGLNFTSDLIELIYDNEKEFNKTMAIIFGISEKEVEDKPLDEVIDVFMAISKCKAFQGLYNKMNK